MNQIPVAGIDVGKRFSEMALLSPVNEVFARIRINHDAYSYFDKAFELLRKAEKEFGAKPVVVMESTGHYHKILFQTLNKNGYEVCVINPIQSDSIKNIRVRKVKNDKVDARKIALLYRFEQLKTANIPDEDIDCLRSLCRHYYNLSEQLTSYKNRLIGIVDQVFLSFNEVFNDLTSNTALALLEKYPTPEDILNANREELISLIQKTARKDIKWATDKYEMLCAKALKFKPLSINSFANAAMLKANIAMIKTLMASLDAALEAILKLLEEDAKKPMPVLSLTIDLLCSIPGIGLLTAATIVGEIGDFSTFSKPEKLVAYFGIDPSVTQSGQFKGTENKMSKRGSKLLRKVIFTSAMVSVSKKRNGKEINPVLYEFYRKKCLSKPKKVALGAVMHKLVAIIFAVLRDRKPFELRKSEEHAKRLAAKNLAS